MALQLFSFFKIFFKIYLFILFYLIYLFIFARTFYKSVNYFFANAIDRY